MGKRIKYHIFTESVTSEAKIGDISSKLPGDVSRLIGFHVGSPNAARATASQEIGRFSLNLNNRASNPIHTSVHASKYGSLKKGHHKFNEVDAELRPNSRVHAFYIDYGLSSVYPYTLKVYLQYESNEEE